MESISRAPRQAAALVYAHQQTAKLAQGDADVRIRRTTLARLFALYREHRTPPQDCGRAARGCAPEMWLGFLGASKDPHKVTLEEWESFIDAWRSGAIDAHGRSVPPESRCPIRTRRVEADLKWLRRILNWGARWRDREGR